MNRKVPLAVVTILAALVCVCVIAVPAIAGNAGQSDRTVLAAKAETDAGDKDKAASDAKAGAAEEEKSKVSKDGTYAIIDTHLHYLDFLQETDGFAGLAKKMDETNVPYAVIFGMAMAKQWDENAPNAPTYYMSNDSRCYYYSATDYIMMEDYNAQPKEVQDRFFPFVCGVNPNDKYAVNHIKRLLETYPDQIYGIGEVMSRHDDLTALTYGEPPRANHPAYLEIYDLAAEHDIPVLIHHNIGPSYTDDPIYMEEMSEALAHNRKAKIIWAHTGISRRVVDSKHLKNVETMLKKNKNLYYDISWVVFEEYIGKSEKSLDKWAALIEKYPDRFMIGSDKVGHWEGYENEIWKYYPLVDRLSDTTKRRVTQTNILKLIHVDAKDLPLLNKKQKQDSTPKDTTKEETTKEKTKETKEKKEEKPAA